MNIDTCTAELNFSKNEKVKLPQRMNWTEENLAIEFDIVIFSDGSKKESDYGALIKNKKFKALEPE